MPRGPLRRRGPGLYAGPVAEGEEVLRPLREFGKPALVGVGHGMHNYNKAHWLAGLPDEAIDEQVRRHAGVPSPMSLIINASGWTGEVTGRWNTPAGWGGSGASWLSASRPAATAPWVDRTERALPSAAPDRQPCTLLA